MQVLILLPIVIALIIWGSTRWKLHPFLLLLMAALVMGFAGGLGASEVITKMTEGFGMTLKSIGIVIAFGTIIGTFLESSGGAQTLANTALKWVGSHRSPLAMNITGFIVSIPVFCDSGFVILSALSRALSKRTGISLAVLAVALATGLYATHVFVPPTPGPLAAAATLDADIGLVLMLGLLVAIPTAGVGLLWALYYARRFTIVPEVTQSSNPEESQLPGKGIAFAPIVVPILLIALKSIVEYPGFPWQGSFLQIVLSFIGHPVVALLIGVFCAFFLAANPDGEKLFRWVSTGLQNAGVIILITGAGGAFGSVLRATGVGDTVGQSLAKGHLGIFLPFIIAAVLKTAQGSSTVSIITTAALMAPLLVPLGLHTAVAKALVVLAIGAGAMTVSHVNDSYFWVVAQFSDMDTATALRCQTLATLVQGITGILVIAILTWILVLN